MDRTLPLEPTRCNCGAPLASRGIRAVHATWCAALAAPAVAPNPWRETALAFERRAMRVEYIIRLLMAAGHVSQAKVDEAFTLAKDYCAAPAVATPAPIEPSELDYDALIKAAWGQHKYAQGTRECIAFKRGAEWAMQVRAALAHPAGGAPEPEYWQWRRKDEPWSLERTFNSKVHATTPDSEVRALFAAHPAGGAAAPAVVATQAMSKPWPEGAVFTDGEGNFYDEYACLLAASPVSLPAHHEGEKA